MGRDQAFGADMVATWESYVPGGEVKGYPSALDRRGAREIRERSVLWFQIVREAFSRTGLRWRPSYGAVVEKLIGTHLQRDWTELCRLVRSETDFARTELLTQALVEARGETQKRIAEEIAAEADRPSTATG